MYVQGVEAPGRGSDGDAVAGLKFAAFVLDVVDGMFQLSASVMRLHVERA